MNCSIQNRPISVGGSFKFYRTWLNIMVVQLTSDYNLKYFLCELTPGPSCSYSIEIPNMGPIDDSAYQLIDKTSDYSISYEALLQR